MPEAVRFKLCGHVWCVQHGVIVLLGFGRRDVSDGLEKPSMVEPVDPFEGGEFNSFKVAPGTASMNDLGLVEAVYRFGEGIVVTVADASDGRLDACFSQALGISDRYILGTPLSE